MKIKVQKSLIFFNLENLNSKMILLKLELSLILTALKKRFSNDKIILKNLPSKFIL